MARKGRPLPGRLCSNLAPTNFELHRDHSYTPSVFPALNDHQHYPRQNTGAWRAESKGNQRGNFRRKPQLRLRTCGVQAG